MKSQASQSPFRSWRGDHIGLRVGSFEEAVRWYVEKLDFRLLSRMEVMEFTYAYIAPAADESFRIELIAGPGKPRNDFEDLHASLDDLGFHHLCMRVENINESLAELKLRGVNIVSEPRYVAPIKSTFAFISDPWGNLIELMERED